MEELLPVTDHTREKALLIGVVQRGQRVADVEDSLNELAQLSSTAGAEVAERMICRQIKPNPATFIGKGKALSIAETVAAGGLTTVVFDDDLSPAQGRNLEELLNVKVLDRTQMILDIFAQHARTKEGSLQIELARLQYLLPRLRHMWKHLERQRGGIGMMAGAGEQQLEMDRRRIEERIVRLRREIDVVRDRRAEQRRGRRRHGWALLTLVGYTNAGKSTLLNRMTGAQVLADDKLFATLDPTTRQLQLPNHQNALVTDTVGFIRKLPHHLVDSFKATLEEVLESDLLVHVVDASHPRVDEQIEAVNEVLRELGASLKPLVVVFNKVDRPEAPGACNRLRQRFPRAVEVSAITGQGLEDLCAELADALRHRNEKVFLRVPQSQGQLLSAIRASGNVFSERYEGGDVVVVASLPHKLAAQCARYQVDPSEAEVPPEEEGS